jgi:membrane protein YqaA with SNARE-associated domain
MVSLAMSEILGGLLVGTAVSGVLPVLNAELLVAGAVVAAPHVALPVIAVVSATGQMSTKSGLFLVARWAPHRLGGRARAALGRAERAVRARGGAASTFVFASALTGLPPFFGVSLLAGAVGMRFGVFFANGVLGRMLRFAAVAWAAREVAGV